MEGTEQLVSQLYRTAVEAEWQAFRAQALALVCAHLGASGGAWWSHGESRYDGELTQQPPGFTSRAALSRIPTPESVDSDVTEIASVSGNTLAYSEVRSNGLVHLVVLEFIPGQRPASADSLRRIGQHLCEAGALALLHYIRRDDWLLVMGRPNRGSGAMVDASGLIYAASERFYELLGAHVNRLPFELPETVLGPEGGDFAFDSLHLRVCPRGGLYQLHARKPLPLDSLSPREQEIARALGNGKTLKSIARQYGIAVSTVANHTTRIYRKLAIYRREDLIELLRLRQGGGPGV
jgi:DNA-binding CsgD family transcriptional regulator